MFWKRKERPWKATKTWEFHNSAGTGRVYEYMVYPALHDVNHIQVVIVWDKEKKHYHNLAVYSGEYRSPEDRLIYEDSDYHDETADTFLRFIGYELHEQPGLTVRKATV